MPGELHTTPPEMRVHETEFRFCSHCQKDCPSGQFYGINRNKGNKNDKFEYLKTCEACRNKPSQKRLLTNPVTPVNVINTPRIRTTSIPGNDKDGAYMADDTSSANRRNPKRKNLFQSPERESNMPRGPIAASNASSPPHSASTGDVIGVGIPLPSIPVDLRLKQGTKRSGSPKAPKPKRKSLNPRQINGNRDHVSESPQPAPEIPDIPDIPDIKPTMIEIGETPSPAPELSEPTFYEQHGDEIPQRETGSYEEEEDTKAESSETTPPADDRVVGQGLRQFADALSDLSQLLTMAADELDEDAVEGLEEEIHHDWRVQEMTTFVDGYFKGAVKRRKRNW